MDAVRFRSRPDAIERQLAYDERDDSRASYNHAQYLDERRKMMQAWADYLQGLRSRENVMPIKHAGAIVKNQPKAT